MKRPPDLGRLLAEAFTLMEMAEAEPDEAEHLHEEMIPLLDQAAALLESAADPERSEDEYELANMYAEIGRREQASHWYARASEHGHPDAGEFLGEEE